MIDKKCPVLQGYPYLKQSIEIACKDVCALTNVNSEIYGIIAEQSRQDTRNIEKAIRTTKKQWWHNIQREPIFADWHDKAVCPPNKEFIRRLAAKFKSEEISDVYFDTVEHVSIYERLFG